MFTDDHLTPCGLRSLQGRFQSRGFGLINSYDLNCDAVELFLDGLRFRARHRSMVEIRADGIMLGPRSRRQDIANRYSCGADGVTYCRIHGRRFEAIVLEDLFQIT